MDDHSVSQALESCIGGLSQELAVTQLSDRVFRFSVASRFVGFMVYALRSFSCQHFKCFFHLWSNGGPLWHREFNDWQIECNEEWTLITLIKEELIGL